ncbi:MAG: Kelch repeat-containing protein [Hyphomicrobiaceae bacterium]
MKYFLGLFLHLLMCGGSVSAQENAKWNSRATLLEARQEIYAGVANGKIYVAGGIGADGAPLASFERYHPKANKWEGLPPLPQPRHHVAVVGVTNKVFAIGGFTGSWPNWQAQSKVNVFDSENMTWSTGPSLPQPRGEQVAVVVGQNIFVIGGRVKKTPNSGTFFEHIDTNLNTCFLATAKKWMPCAPMPTARNSHAAAVIDGKIYVVGGRRNVFDAGGRVTIDNLAILEVYNPEANSWTTRAPMPIAQGGLAAAAHSGRLYVFGGEQFTPHQKVFANVWVYDPGLDHWSALPPLPTPRHGLAAAAIGQEIYAIGGASRVGFGAVLTNEALMLK